MKSGKIYPKVLFGDPKHTFGRTSFWTGSKLTDYFGQKLNHAITDKNIWTKSKQNQFEMATIKTDLTGTKVVTTIWIKFFEITRHVFWDPGSVLSSRFRGMDHTISLIWIPHFFPIYICYYDFVWYLF